MEHSPDSEGIKGLYLSKELPKQAGRVLEKCVRKIAPEIMTWGQYAGKCREQPEAELGGPHSATACPAWGYPVVGETLHMVSCRTYC